jgi:hypothetical protein
MTPTLLEIALALVLLWVAWQLGVALAPAIRRGLRAMRRDLDGAHDDERDRQ